MLRAVGFVCFQVFGFWFCRYAGLRGGVKIRRRGGEGGAKLYFECPWGVMASPRGLGLSR